MRPLLTLHRALTLSFPVTPARYIAFIGRLFVLYIFTGLLGGLLALLAASVYALASAAPQHPAPSHAYGCSVTLPNTPDDIAPLTVRTVRPLSDCDESAPVAFGASIRDNAGGRRR